MPYKDINKQREWQRNYKARKNAEGLRIMREIKNAPCADCNQKYPYYVMDFDHLGDKESKVSSLVGNVELMLQEIEKCEVICANCHRERTHQRNSYNSY